MSNDPQSSPSGSTRLSHLLFWWAVALLAVACFTALMLLIGSGLLAVVVLLAASVPLQYMLWGWWLGPRLRRIDAAAEESR